MLFHTWVFFVFFLIVYPVYLLVRRNNQLMNIWLMIASYTFYGWWNPWYLLLLFGTSAIDYLMVLLMERSQRTRTFWLVISLVSNFGFLGYFKYSGFITENLNAFLAQLGLVRAAARPDRVSQRHALASGRSGRPLLHQGDPAHRHLLPHVPVDELHHRRLQGHDPDRAQLHALPDVRLVLSPAGGRADRARATTCCRSSSERRRSRGRTSPTACRSSWWASSRRWRWPTTWPSMWTRSTATPASSRRRRLILATVAFGWQIYFDFSGYTDMARGIALLMGFRMMLNFNNPTRPPAWAISGTAGTSACPPGSRITSTSRWAAAGTASCEPIINMFITMVVSGIWHGAAWTFVIWGGLHALGRCLTRELEQTEFYQERIPRLVKQMAVFTFVTFTWIFFRAQSLTDAWLIISRIFTTGWADPRFPLVMAVLVLAVWLYQLLYTSRSSLRWLIDVAPVRVGLAALMIAYLAIVAQPSTKQFIYFQF